MLKIKNDKLQELEKFGFNKDGDEYKYFDDDTSEYIGVQEKNGYIYVENYHPGLLGAIVEEKALDKLYDLIQAGLVEKARD